MNIQGFQKLTLLDFPGRTACTVFTGGCNLRCPFCHNAGLVRTPLEHPNAREEVLAYLSKRQGILDGVCVTGGEPLLQPDLADFLREVRSLGYRVKLDTNGSLPDRLEALLAQGLVDYVAMDVKSSPAGYEAAVGTEVDVAVYDRSIRILRDSGIPYEFRTTAVKGLHTVESIAAAAKWIEGAKEYYLQQFKDSGQLLRGEGLGAFNEEEMNALADAARPYVPAVKLRGL